MKRVIIFLIIFLFPVAGFSANYNGTIITWGYGELIKNILDGIAFLTHNNGLSYIVKSAVAISLFILFQSGLRLLIIKKLNSLKGKL